MRYNSNNRYDDDKSMLNSIRSLNESDNKKPDAIPITDDSRFGDHVLQNQIDNFRQTVEPSAKFGKVNPDDPQSNPLVFFPATGNLVFSGSIPTLSNLRFQFSLNDINSAPYIFVDGLALSEEAINVINKIRGYYLNWRESWFSQTDLLEKL